MITCDTAALLADLDKFHKEATRKMKGMAREFAESVAFVAIENTPIGDSIANSRWYKERSTNPSNQSYGLQPIEGFAKGSWRADLDGSLEMQEFYTATAGAMALSSVKASLGDYKLGDKIMISNYGPYIESLENNYSPKTRGEGIVKPTMDTIWRTYQMKLDDYYNQS